MGFFLGGGSVFFYTDLLCAAFKHLLHAPRLVEKTSVLRSFLPFQLLGCIARVASDCQNLLSPYKGVTPRDTGGNRVQKINFKCKPGQEH